MTDADTKNLALLLAYDGRAFFGWQRHPGKTTVQGTLEDRLSEIAGSRVIVEGSGRTDRGTHALGQVATVRMPSETQAADVLEAFKRDAPAEKAGELELLDAVDVNDAFHARKSAHGKTYRYVLWNDETLPEERDGRVWHVHGTLDLEAMGEALPYFVGTHDFASFATSGGFKRASTTRTMRLCEMTADSPQVELIFRADGFLYKMVRNLVRTIVRVGEGRTSPEQIKEILDARDRRSAPGTAPASGLFLDEVRYPKSPFDRPEEEAPAPPAEGGTS